jgi:hypothetical protein
MLALTSLRTSCRWRYCYTHQDVFQYVGNIQSIQYAPVAFLAKWARRTKSLDALLSVLYLRGVSTGDFQEVLTALLGKDAPNLSPAVITRLTAELGRLAEARPLSTAIRLRVGRRSRRPHRHGRLTTPPDRPRPISYIAPGVALPPTVREAAD